MRLVFLILISLFVVGCATNKPFTALPKADAEYSQSKGDLTRTYPDISTYEKKWRGLNPNYPLEEDLFSQLGQPNVIKRDWWYAIVMIGTAAVIMADPIVWGIVLAVRPGTPKYYYFRKGAHCIKANIDRTFVSGYQPYMTFWEWSDKQEECGK